MSAKPDPPRSPESRRLKIVGLVLLGITVPAFGVLTDQAESKAWLTADKWQLASMALLYMGAPAIGLKRQVRLRKRTLCGS